MSLRAEACNAYRHDNARRLYEQEKKAAADRLRHFECACNRLRSWGITVPEHMDRLPVEHKTQRQIGRSAMSFTYPAFEFEQDGLRFRVTETPKFVYYMESQRHAQDEPFVYDVFVLLPRPRKGWRRVLPERQDWIRVVNKTDLGAWLVARGLCT